MLTLNLNIKNLEIVNKQNIYKYLHMRGINMIQIKICGITNKKEIEYLNILKPEYIGFVFTKSKRQVTGEEAKELCCNLDKRIKTVGVFKDNSINEILDIFQLVPLDIIQLHGKEDDEFISSLKKNINDSTKIWKALSIKDFDNIKRYISNNFGKNNENRNSELIDNFLIDGDNPGSGEVFALENISELFGKNNRLQYNFFLAGGITEENVIERIEKVKPSGVDVSSGAEVIDESGNRTKSFEKMKSLIEKVRNNTN